MACTRRTVGDTHLSLSSGLVSSGACLALLLLATSRQRRQALSLALCLLSRLSLGFHSRASGPLLSCSRLRFSPFLVDSSLQG